MKTITQHMQLSKQQRQAHIDLSSPCIPVIQNNNTSVKKAGEYANPIPGSRVAKKTLIEHHNLEKFNGRAEKVHTCHMCKNDSQARNGFVCMNPEHLYFGTISENHHDIPPEVRKQAASKAGKAGGKIGGKIGMANGNHNTLTKAKCVHCGYESNIPLITRWHNDNCKHKV